MELTLEGIAKDMANLRQSYEEKVAQNRRIDEQIDALKRARAHAQDAYNHAKAGEKRIKGIEKDASWVGKGATSYENARTGTLTSDGEAFTSGIDDFIGQISSTIWSLQLKKDHLVGLIDSILSGIDELDQTRKELLAKLN